MLLSQKLHIMSTRKQLHRRWKRDMEFDLGYGCSHTKLPEFTEFTGPVIGKVIYDENAKTVTIVPDFESQKPQTK